MFVDSLSDTGEGEAEAGEALMSMSTIHNRSPKLPPIVQQRYHSQRLEVRNI